MLNKVGQAHWFGSHLLDYKCQRRSLKTFRYQCSLATHMAMGTISHIYLTSESSFDDTTYEYLWKCLFLRHTEVENIRPWSVEGKPEAHQYQK